MIAKIWQFNGFELKKLNGINQQAGQQSPCRVAARPRIHSTNPTHRPSFPLHSAKQAGITIIEVLVVLAVIAITVGIATGSTKDLAYRADLRVATEMIQQSVRMARNRARMEEKDMQLMFTDVDEYDQVRIELNSPSERYAQPILEDIRLPPGIMIMSPDRQFSFNSRGVLDEPGTITIAAEKHKDEFRHVQVDR